jgi:hypothetical protein
LQRGLNEPVRPHGLGQSLITELLG